MGSTVTKLTKIQLHSGGVANCASYPDISIDLKITLTHAGYVNEDSPVPVKGRAFKVNWQVDDIKVNLGEPGDLMYDWEFYCEINVNEPSTQSGLYYPIISKPPTSGANWAERLTHPNVITGSLIASAASKYAEITFIVKDTHCKNNGSNCYHLVGGKYTVAIRRLLLPDPEPGGGGGTSTGHKVIYDAGLGTNAPAPQTIYANTPLKLTTKTPDYSCTIGYSNFTDRGSHSISDVTDSETLNLRLHHWVAHYTKYTNATLTDVCDGINYNYPREVIESQNINRAYAIPFGVKEVIDKEITLKINAGLTIPVYHWLSGKAPKDSRYPFYYAIDTYILPEQAYFSGPMITFGVLDNKIWKPTPPPKGAQIIFSYVPERGVYSKKGDSTVIPGEGTIYYPGDIYDTSGLNANRDVYMEAVYDTALLTPIPIPDMYNTVKFDFNGGTGAPSSMPAPLEKKGYCFPDRRNMKKTQYFADMPLYHPDVIYDVRYDWNQDESTPRVIKSTLDMGDGITTVFNLPSPCCEIQEVTVNDVTQRPSTYSFYNRTLIFAEPPPIDSKIRCLYYSPCVYHSEHFTGDGRSNTFILENVCHFLNDVTINGESYDLDKCSFESNSVTITPTPVSGASIDIDYLTFLTLTENFKGDGETSGFVLPHSCHAVEYVKINGTEQDRSTYNASGLQLLFNEAPANNANIEIRYYTNILCTDYGLKAWLHPWWGDGHIPYDQLPVPTKSGSGFGGWYYDSGLSKPVSKTDGLIIPYEEREITVYAKWGELPIKRFEKDGKWHSIDPTVWQFGSDHQWHKVAHVYMFIKNEGEEEGHWEDISGIVT